MADARLNAAQFHVDLGLTCAAMGATGAAIEALRKATQLNPSSAHAWRKLGELLRATGDRDGAAAAYAAAGALTETRARPAFPAPSVSTAKIDKAEQKI